MPVRPRDGLAERPSALIRPPQQTLALFAPSFVRKQLHSLSESAGGPGVARIGRVEGIFVSPLAWMHSRG